MDTDFPAHDPVRFWMQAETVGVSVEPAESNPWANPDEWDEGTKHYTLAFSSHNLGTAVIKLPFSVGPLVKGVPSNRDIIVTIAYEAIDAPRLSAALGAILGYEGAIELMEAAAAGDLQ